MRERKREITRENDSQKENEGETEREGMDKQTDIDLSYMINWITLVVNQQCDYNGEET